MLVVKIATNSFRPVNFLILCIFNSKLAVSKQIELVVGIVLEHFQPSSTIHFAEHPSPSIKLPSSHP